MTTHLMQPIRLASLAALLAVGYAGNADAGISFSIGSTRHTGSGIESLRFSVGSGSSRVSYGTQIIHPSHPMNCRYVERRVLVPGHWECRQEQRRVIHCGRSHYETVTVRHWVPSYTRIERTHHPHCVCRHGHGPVHGRIGGSHGCR